MRPTVLALASLLLAPLPLAAQTVRGEVVEPSSRAAVPAVRVLLLDPQGRVVASTRTADDGSFVLRAPAGGRFTVRAERPGFLSTASAPLVVGVGETASTTISAGTPVVLEGIDVRAASRCVVRPGEGTATAAVWEEARKALDAARETFADRSYRFRVRNYARDVSQGTKVVQQDSTSTAELLAERPYRAVPLALIAQRGYVFEQGDTLIYNIPDAEILLSDEFLDGHCFRIAPASERRQGQVGLAFEPVRGGGAPDVKGVLWLGRQPLELRSLEYEYTRPPMRGPGGTPGGTVEFRPLPNGRWIVSRWQLRMPLHQEAPSNDPVFTLSTAQRPRRVIEAIREQGGEVTEILTRRGEVVAMEKGATLAGAAWDSIASRPLAGARVVLEGTRYETVTDSLGRYALRFLPEGSFAVRLHGARLDSLGYTPPAATVTLVRDQTVMRDFAIPPFARVQAAACGEGGALSGIVRMTGSGMVAPGVRVSASWDEGGLRVERASQADESGVYRLCGVPSGVAVALAAAGGDGRPAASREVRLAAGTPVQHDLTVAERALALDPVLAVGRTEGQQMARSQGTRSMVMARAAIEAAEPGKRNLIDLIRGRFAGVHIVEYQDPQGRPLTCVGSSRGNTSTATDGRRLTACRSVQVVLDGILQNESTDVLRRLTPREIESIEFLSAAQGAIRFGTSAGETPGYLVIYTRGMGPHRGAAGSGN